ncbi:MAG: hypothetical protein JSV02_00275 [Dehalococcoidia bacterium]|nr:MAG: hypothetical protein JSV02_00275 [Dehalococcoidia bacterium]
MSRRAKIITITIAMLLLITVGLTTFVLAQESAETEVDIAENPKQTFISKVANILGIEEEQLVNAFKQAHQEMKAEFFERCLQHALDNECINKQEADQIREWQQSMPDVLQDCGQKMRLRLRDRWNNNEWPCPMPCR